MPDLSDEQSFALSRIDRFLSVRSGPATFSLQGLAGTGKTFTLAELARHHPEAALGAPTGKAAAVLRARTGLDVRTIHSLIYDFKGISEDEETGRRQPVFIAKEDAGLRGKVAFLDEASMCGTRIIGDLLDTGARVVACGDPGQLKPVADAQFFDRADVTLREIHRQARESAVVRQAHQVRANGLYRTDGPDFAVTGYPSDDVLRSANVALCWRNATRRALNQRIRTVTLGKDISPRQMHAGEPVMCLKNDYALRIFNGETYPLARDRAPGDDLTLEVDGRIISALNAVVEDVDGDFNELRHEDTHSPFALAYAATVHKAQGSEWDHVLIVDEFRGAEDERRSFLYTGITRAAKRVTMVRARI
jgi:exodeoxyribonuclease V